MLEWAEVAGAAHYHVEISHDSDFDDLIVDDTTADANFSPTGLSFRKTCYWRVYAVDAYGNSGSKSEVWSFRSPDNVSPFANIACPMEGLIYVQSDIITFTGSGSDLNDGDLSGDALVWSSDLHGEICSGETCASDLLEAGLHRISLTVTDSEAVSHADTVTIVVNADHPSGTLPDTGQITSHTETFGEDSDYTRNPPAYTKLDANGNELEPCAAQWAMVRDDVTGLVWEVKTDDGSIHDKDDKYVLRKAQESDLDARLDFIKRLNDEQFGGQSQWPWRLPTIKELHTLANKGNYNPAISAAYFPNTIGTAYWADTDHTANGVDDAWYDDSGYDNYHDKSNSCHVRAVRGKEVTNEFVDNNNDTVTDLSTGLMWQKLEVTDDNGNARKMVWEEALAYCERLELAGYDDWRLPNSNELQSIVDYLGLPEIQATCCKCSKIML
jgi:hypothetical protein